MLLNYNLTLKPIFTPLVLSILANIHKTEQPLLAMIEDSKVPIALTKNDGVIAVAAVDYLTWDKRVSDFFFSTNKQLNSTNLKTKQLIITGYMSPETKTKDQRI